MVAAMVAVHPVCLTADTSEGLALVGAQAERGGGPAAPLHEWLRRALASDGLVALSVAPPAGAGEGGAQEVSAVVGEALLEEPAGPPAGAAVERGWASLQLHDQGPGPGAAVGAFSTLGESLRGAGLEPAGLVAAGSGRLLVPRQELPAAAGAALRAGHALTPIGLLQPGPPEGLPARDSAGCKAYAGAWGLMRRKLAGGAAVSEYRAGSSRAPVRLQAACGLFVEVPGVGAGAGALPSGRCGVLEVVADGLVRHPLVDLRPPSGEPCGVEASLQGALLAESSRPAGAWQEEWARLGAGEEVVALELAAEPGRAGPARRGGWLFCGGRFARVVGPPQGSGVVSGACCGSLGQLQRLRGEEAVRQELEGQFEAVSGTIDRPGLLQTSRQGSSKPRVFWSASGGEGGEISRQGEEVVHLLPGGAEQRWRILEWGFDPFATGPKEEVREEKKSKDKKRKKLADSGGDSDDRGKKNKAAHSESGDERRKDKKKDKHREEGSSSDSDAAAKRKKDKQKEKEPDKRKDKDKKKKEKAADSDDDSDDRGKSDRKKDKKKDKRKEEGSSDSSGAAAKRKRDKNKEKESDKRREKDGERSASEKRRSKKDRSESRSRDRKKLQVLRSRSPGREREAARGERDVADAAAAPVEVPSPAAADPVAAAGTESLGTADRGSRGSKITISLRPPPAGPPSHVTLEMVRKSAADADRVAAVDALLKKAVAGVSRKEDPAPAPPPALMRAPPANAESGAPRAPEGSAVTHPDTPVQSKASTSAPSLQAKAQAPAPEAKAQAPAPAPAVAASAAAAVPAPGASAPAQGSAPPPAEQTKAKPLARPAGAPGKAAPPAQEDLPRDFPFPKGFPPPDPSAEKADLPANFAFPKGYPPPEPSAEKADLPSNFAFPKGYPPPAEKPEKPEGLPANFAFPQGYPPPPDFPFPEGYPPPPEGQPSASQAAAEAQAQAQAQAHAQAHAMAAAQATAAVHAQAAAAAQAAAIAATGQPAGQQQPPPPGLLPGMPPMVMGMPATADPNLHAAMLMHAQLMMGAGAAFPPGFPGASPVGLPLPGGQVFVPAPAAAPGAVGGGLSAQQQAAMPAQPNQPQVVSPPARAAAADPAVEQFLQETRADQRASGALRALPAELQRRVVAEGPVSGTNPSAVLMARVRKVEVQDRGAAAGTAPGAAADAAPAAQGSTQMQPMAGHTAPGAQPQVAAQAAFAARPPPPSGLPPGGGAVSKAAGSRAAGSPIGPAIGPAPAAAASGLFSAGSPEAVFVQQNRVGREAEAALCQLSETLRARVMIEGPVGGANPSVALMARIQKIQMAHSSAA